MHAVSQLSWPHFWAVIMAWVDELRRIDTAHDQLDAGAPQSPSRTLPVHLFMLALDGEHERAADLAADWLRGPRGAEDLESPGVTPVLAATVLSAAGRFAEADDAARYIERCTLVPEDSIELAWARMAICDERGERAAALVQLRDVQRALDRAGHLAAAIWVRAMACRLLFVLGRRHAAAAVLAEAREMSHRCGTSAYERLFDAAAAEDLLHPGWLTHAAPGRASRAGDTTRAQVKAVLRLASRGSSVLAVALPRMTIPDADDHGLDRALLELAHAIVARQRGQRRVETQRLRAALAHASAAGVDDDLLPALYEGLLDSAMPGLRAGVPQSSNAVVIDGTHHEIRGRGRRIALGARRAIRSLLYAFAGASSNHLTRAMIAHALWGTDYDPLRHDSTIKSSIRRLRVLLAGIAEVHSEHEGYHLVLPAEAVFIPPVVSP